MKRLLFLFLPLLVIIGCGGNNSNVFINGYDFVLPEHSKMLKKDKFLVDFCGNRLNVFKDFQAPLYNAYACGNVRIFMALCTGGDSTIIRTSLASKFIDSIKYTNLSTNEYMVRDSNAYSAIKYYNLSNGNKYLILISGYRKEEVAKLLHHNYFIPKS